MRAVKKSVGRFLQNVAFKINTSRMSLEIPMQFSLYFFTTSHPYAPLGVGNLADEIGVYTQILVCIIFQNKKH
jgi:hypothetical protein